MEVDDEEESEEEGWTESEEESEDDDEEAAEASSDENWSDTDEAVEVGAVRRTRGGNAAERLVDAASAAATVPARSQRGRRAAGSRPCETQHSSRSTTRRAGSMVSTRWVRPWRGRLQVLNKCA